jgi:hypothetical protein
MTGKLIVLLPCALCSILSACLVDKCAASCDCSAAILNLQMPTGTGKTITLLSLITSYQLAHPEVGTAGQTSSADSV